MVTLFLAGDVMLGRGIDQILPEPGDPRLHEPAVDDATAYVRLAERANGPIPRRVAYDYVWGDALATLERLAPDARIINLETSITRSDDAWPKGINYRMNPANVDVLAAALIDGCTLANNHVLDWGRAGLIETLQALERRGVRSAGAGLDEVAAAAPAALDLAGGGRLLIYAFGSPTSGIPDAWAAGPGRPGVNLLAEPSAPVAADLGRTILATKQPRDVVVASIHWGGNWGYEVPAAQRTFAHALIDLAGVDIVHGHSSHHPKAIEVYRERPILYGCGDFLNDYEGIEGYEQFRDDLTLMYLPTVAPSSGRLTGFRLVPFQIRKLRLNHPQPADAAWLHRRLNRECARFGVRLEPAADGTWSLSW